MISHRGMQCIRKFYVFYIYLFIILKFYERRKNNHVEKNKGPWIFLLKKLRCIALFYYESLELTRRVIPTANVLAVHEYEI